jgi:hypothetical protein
MALTILKQNVRQVHAGGNGYLEIDGIAQFTGTNVTGELDCQFSNICDWSCAPLATPGLLGVLDNVHPGTISATAIFNHRVKRTGVVSASSLIVPTTVAADAANIWTIGIVNKGNAGAGNTVIVDNTAPANSNNSTGGSAFTANVERALTLSGTPANLNVVAGDILLYTITKAASAPNLVLPEFTITYSSPGTDEVISVGETVDSKGVIVRPSKKTLTINRTGSNPASGMPFSFRYRGW